MDSWDTASANYDRLVFIFIFCIFQQSVELDNFFLFLSVEALLFLCSELVLIQLVLRNAINIACFLEGVCTQGDLQ